MVLKIINGSDLMLNVVFSSDDAYSALLAVAVTSLLENNSQDFDSINVYILDNGISAAGRERISLVCENYPCRVTFIKSGVAESMDISLVPMDGNAIASSSLTTYNRLFLSTLLPPDVDKVIYLDCDGIVTGSLKPLWMSDISDVYCAGVIQSSFTRALKREFWFFDVDNYINAGFLYINLKKWRCDNVEDDFIKFLSAHQGEYFCADQGVLNKTFEGKIRIIEPKYNLIGSYQDYDFTYSKKLKFLELDNYSKETIISSSENPVFVHFAGESDLPWLNCQNKYFHDFKRYAEICGAESIIRCSQTPSRFSGQFKRLRRHVLKLIIFLAPAGFLIRRSDRHAIEVFEAEVMRAQNRHD